MKKVMLLVGLFLFAAVFVSAMETLTDTGTAKAKIISAAELDNVRDLDFGTIIPGASAGTVTIANADASSATDVNVKRATGTVSSAKFVLSNLDAAHSYNVAVDASVVITSSTNNMTVSSMGVSDSTVTGVTTKDLFVGGQLAVPSGQAAGEYSGDFTMTVTY